MSSIHFSLFLRTFMLKKLCVNQQNPCNSTGTWLVLTKEKTLKFNKIRIKKVSCLMILDCVRNEFTRVTFSLKMFYIFVFLFISRHISYII